ncbi:MAG: hypothetical protein AAGC55_03710, partial [Myxococcota bacterium]
ATIHTTRDLESAVLRSIQGQADDAIAAGLGVTVAALRQWVTAYRDAGCAALRALTGATDDEDDEDPAATPDSSARSRR